MPFAWDPTGSVGVIGVYIAPDSGAKDEQRKQGIFSFPLANFFEKGLTIGTGQDPVKKYNEYLRHLIVSGRAQNPAGLLATISALTKRQRPTTLKAIPRF